ncbi:hypothetical protein BJ912DRAFT_1103376 [Pholiota molesta]|nr:hypothetical protein BJ912DRAFT_1103376 [Pholiota molesta]
MLPPRLPFIAVCLSTAVSFLPTTDDVSVVVPNRCVDSLADFGTTVAVAIGSTIVMMLWIVVYSFFPSPDFIDEVSMLFGTIYFWAAVFLSAIDDRLPQYTYFADISIYNL